MVSKAGDEKGKKWFAIIVGIIMLMSVAGFVISFQPSSSDSNFKYEGVLFQFSPKGFYIATLGSQQATFFFNPDDVSGITLPDGLASRLSAQVISVSYDWNSSFVDVMALAAYDVENLLDFKHGTYVQKGTSRQGTDFPFINCNNATSLSPVILLSESNLTGISFDLSSQNCIVVSGASSQDFARASDRLKYAILEGG